MRGNSRRHRRSARCARRAPPAMRCSPAAAGSPERPARIRPGAPRRPPPAGAACGRDRARGPRPAGSAYFAWREFTVPLGAVAPPVEGAAEGVAPGVLGAGVDDPGGGELLRLPATGLRLVAPEGNRLSLVLTRAGARAGLSATGAGKSCTLRFGPPCSAAPICSAVGLATPRLI